MNLYFFISTSVSIIFTDILIWDSFLLIDAMYYHKKSEFFSYFCIPIRISICVDQFMPYEIYRKPFASKTVSNCQSLIRVRTKITLTIVLY